MGCNHDCENCIFGSCSIDEEEEKGEEETDDKDNK